MQQRVLGQCSCGMWFVGEFCPQCGSFRLRNVEFRAGDCVACGGLCSGLAYCCDNPQPLTVDAYDRVVVLVSM